ncbi:MAG: DUF2149 domain-containing protein [Oscillibacter sp.]|nr:DUF2149 domain-containing protein [Oscillibacter sp.]
MRRRFTHNGPVIGSEEDVNPMDYIPNLADAMLVLAVGIMMALVVAWKVDIANTVPQASDVADAQALEDTVNSLDVSDVESDKDVPVDEYGLSEYGMLYRDASGNLYVVKSEVQTENGR